MTHTSINSTTSSDAKFDGLFHKFAIFGMIYFANSNENHKLSKTSCLILLSTRCPASSYTLKYLFFIWRKIIGITRWNFRILNCACVWIQNQTASKNEAKTAEKWHFCWLVTSLPMYLKCRGLRTDYKRVKNIETQFL